MVLRVEVDPKRPARLHLMLTRANSKDRNLSGIQVIDFEVEMLLLGMLLARPLRRLVVLNALETQGCPRVTGQLDPVIIRGGLIDRPAGNR